MKNGITIMICLILRFTPMEAQKIPQVDREDIASITGKVNDTTYVVNFWATWCSPCVKELGYFEELHREHRSSKLKVYLVSLDFPNQLERRVLPFLAARDISAEVLLVTDLKYNEWIDRVDPTWSGAIPATLIYRADKRIFLEKELTREELFNSVNQILN